MKHKIICLDCANLTGDRVKPNPTVKMDAPAYTVDGTPSFMERRPKSKMVKCQECQQKTQYFWNVPPSPTNPNPAQ